MTLEENLNKAIDRLTMSLTYQQLSDLALLRNEKLPLSVDEKSRFISSMVIK